VVLFGLTMASFAEGVSFLALLPLLELLMESGRNGGAPGDESSYVSKALDFFGLDPSVSVVLSVIAISLAAKGLIRFMTLRYAGHVIAEVGADLRHQLLSSALRSDWSHLSSLKGGSLPNAMSIEASKAAGTYISLIQTLAYIMQAGVLIAMAATVDPTIVACGIAIGIVVTCVFKSFLTITSREAARGQTALRGLSDHIIDLLRGLKPVKAMHRERELESVLRNEIDSVAQSFRRITTSKQAIANFMETSIALVLLGGMWIVLTFFDIEVASLLVVSVIMYRTAISIGQSQSWLQSLNTSAPYLRSIEELDRSARAHEERSSGDPVPAGQLSVAFHKVDFYYGSQPVLQDLTFELPSTGITALVGPSGSGKTTIVDLICGLYQPAYGVITINGQDLQTIDLHEWRSVIGYVPQDPLLLESSIRENVTLGDTAITDSEVLFALERAGLGDFIHRLERGIATPLSTGGTGISGGQRQRVAIARALARKPRLLLLDEATTGLDEAVEQEVLESVKGIAVEIPVLAISHQPRLLKVTIKTITIHPPQTHASLQEIEGSGPNAITR